MKVLIIGLGPAAIKAISTLRQSNDFVEITVITAEDYLYYFRPLLPELISQKKEEKALFPYQKDWFSSQKIELIFKQTAELIDANNKLIKTKQAEFNFDKLLICTGALAKIPKIKNIEKTKNIYTLRTIKDAYKIKAVLKDKKSAIVVGGGLLGLELAGNLATMGIEAKIVEFAKTLLNRQLDPKKGQLLAEILDKKGFHFCLNEAIAELDNIENERVVAKTANGNEIDADVLIFSAGAIPNISLAKNSNLETNRGIVVNNFLETSTKDIFAAGDCIELEGKTWGFVKSAMQQGEIAAKNILDYKDKYFDTEIKPVLKVAGINLEEL